MIQPVPVAALAPVAPVVRELLQELGAAVGGRISSSDQDRIAYSRDMWPLAMIWIRDGKIPPPPDAVVWPRSADEVVELIKLARANKLAVIPFGAGSGVCGGTWAVQGGIALDMKRMDAVGQVDADYREVTVQAGVIGEVLERQLNAQGYTLGHFPSSIYMSTLGGWLAARSAGQLSNKYGKIEDMVVSVSGVLGTGETFQTPPRGHAGPDLAQLLIGSEGTLCTFTEAVLRVHPTPEHRTFHGYKVRTVEAGVNAIRALYRAGLRPSVVRLYDPFDTALVGKEKKAHTTTPPSLRTLFTKDTLPALARRLSPLTVGRPGLMNKAAHLLKECLLVVLFEGERNRVIAEDRAAQRICLDAGAEDLGEEPGRRWFSKRYAVSYKLSKVIDNGAFADTMEVACGWDKVLDVYERVRAAVSPLAFVLCHFSHAYLDGCSLYFSFVSSETRQHGSDQRYADLWRVAMTAALSAGANVSHHHGVGLLKAQALRDSLGDRRRALVALKRTFDPDGVMNPGKLSL